MRDKDASFESVLAAAPVAAVRVSSGPSVPFRFTTTGTLPLLSSSLFKNSETCSNSLTINRHDYITRLEACFIGGIARTTCSIFAGVIYEPR